MEQQDFSLSKSGTAVWTRVSGMWWPGEITTDYPKQLIPEKKEKDKICVVKFCLENDYQVIFKQSEIKLYNKEEKEDLIRKGLNKLKSGKPDLLENFKTDVKNAERLTGGDEEVLDKISSTPQTPKLPAYAGLFKSSPTVPASATPPKHGQIKFNFIKRAHPSPKKPNATGAATNVNNSDKQFVCDKCGFGTDRVGTLTAHLKSHTMPFGFGVEGPPKAAPVQVGRVFTKSTPNPSTLFSSTRLKTVPVAEVAPSPKKTTPKKSPIKSKETAKSVQKSLPPKKRKMTSEVAKKEILADWVGEDGNGIQREDTSNYHEKSDEDDSALEPKIPRRTEKELADTFEALLNAKRSEVPETKTSIEEGSPKPETTVAATAVAETLPDKSLRSKEQEIKTTSKTSTPEPTSVLTRERRGAETRRSGTVKESTEVSETSVTPKIAATPRTRSSARNQDRTTRSEANTEPVLSLAKEERKKKGESVSQTEANFSDKDDELLNATEALLNETKMPMATTPGVPPRLSDSSTKASLSDKSEEKRETSPKRAVASERTLRSTSPPKPPSPTKATTVSSPEKKQTDVKPPAVAAEYPKSPPLPKLIPTPSPSTQSVTATVTSAAIDTNQKVIIKPSTNSKSEVVQEASAVPSAASSPTKASVNAPRATSPVKVAVSSAAPLISTPPKLVPVGTKSRVPSSPQASVTQQIAVSTSPTIPKPSKVKVQVTSSPPKLIATPGVSFVTPNEKVVVSQIIPASIATEKPVTSSVSSPASTKVLVSSITPTAVKAGPATTPPVSASQKVLVTPATSVRPTSLSNNVHSASRSPAAILSRTPQTRPPVRQQVAVPGRGSSIPPILRSPKATTPTRSTVGQVATSASGTAQQIVVATKSAPEKSAPTIAFAQKSTVPQAGVASLPQKPAPTVPGLAASHITASKQAAAATAVKSAVAALPKPPNILAQKSTIQSATASGSGTVVAQKSTVPSGAVTQSIPAAMTQKISAVVSNVASSLNNSALASQKPPVSSLPPLGPPPPIPGIATSVSQEMLAAAAAQPSTARKRPAPKPKPPKSPPKKGKPDVGSTMVANSAAAAGGQLVEALQEMNFPSSQSGIGCGAPSAARLIRPLVPANASGYTTYVRSQRPNTEAYRPTVVRNLPVTPALPVNSTQVKVQLVLQAGAAGEVGEGMTGEQQQIQIVMAAAEDFDSEGIPTDQVGQMMHMIPVDQGDGTTRYIVVRVDQAENGKGPVLEMGQTDAANPRAVQPQDQDRAEGLYVEGEGNLGEALSSVQAQERLQHPPQGSTLQLTQTTEADTSGNTNTITFDNMEDAQQHLINNSGHGQAVLIQQANGQQHIFTTEDGTQQYALDQQHLAALAGGDVEVGDGSDQVYYIVDYNGDQQFLQLFNPEGEGQAEPEPPAAQ